MTSALDAAVSELLQVFRVNRWFLETYWPESEARIRLMISDSVSRVPPGPGVRALDIGCFNGSTTFLLHRLGYEATGTDSADLDDRREIFTREGIRFFRSNLNELNALADLPEAHFDCVFFGEVIEHVLNHPLGLMRSIARAMKPGGVLVLSTPNPSTVMNAARVLAGRASLWGTPEFMDVPKIDGSSVVISVETIHYREYLTGEMLGLLDRAGFGTEAVHYMGIGAAETQPRLKRILKRLPVVKRLMSLRPFAATHVFVARRRDGAA